MSTIFSSDLRCRVGIKSHLSPSFHSISIPSVAMPGDRSWESAKIKEKIEAASKRKLTEKKIEKASMQRDDQITIELLGLSLRRSPPLPDPISHVL